MIIYIYTFIQYYLKLLHRETSIHRWIDFSVDNNLTSGSGIFNRTTTLDSWTAYPHSHLIIQLSNVEYLNFKSSRTKTSYSIWLCFNKSDDHYAEERRFKGSSCELLNGIDLFHIQKLLIDCVVHVNHYRMNMCICMWTSTIRSSFPIRGRIIMMNDE